MKLSIIIVNYHNRGLIREVLKYLAENKLSFSYDIHIVDNFSNDGIEEMIKNDYPNVIFYKNKKNIGFGKANNIALKASRGKYVLLLNPDIITTKEAIETLVTFMDTHAQIGISGPRLVNPDGTLQHTCYSFPTLLTPLYRRTILGKTIHGQQEQKNYLMLDKDHTVTQPVPWVQGSAMMIRRSLLQIVGFFDERYFMYMEDVDICRRFWEKRIPVYYIAEAEMVHYHKRASAGENFFYFITNTSFRSHAVSFIRYMIKFAGKPVPNTIDKGTPLT